MRDPANFLSCHGPLFRPFVDDWFFPVAALAIGAVLAVTGLVLKIDFVDFGLISAPIQRIAIISLGWH